MKPTTLLAVLPLAVLLAAPAAAQAYTIDQPQGNDTFGARSTGQTFTPGVGIMPASGASIPVQFLTEVTLYHGNFSSATPSTTTWLKIYDGDPTTTGNFVGISSNSVDTTGLSFHTLMHWDFPQLVLLTATEYWAVMSSTTSPTSIDAAEVSLETANRNIASPNAYAGGSGLIANIVPHPNSVDARFKIDFFTGVIGSFTVAGTGCPSSAGLATVSAAAAPQIGTPFQVDFGNLAPAGLPYVAFGFSDTVWSGNPLPIPLATFVPGAAASCLILVAPDATSALALNGTNAALTIPIPNLAGLAGLTFHLQGMQLEPTGVSVTAKGTVLVGN